MIVPDEAMSNSNDNSDNNNDIDTKNNYFLTASDNYKDALLIENTSDPQLVQLSGNQSYSGVVVFNFTLNKTHYCAVKTSRNENDKNIIEIELFGQPFKGFIVKFHDLKVMPKDVQYKHKSRQIDENHILFIEDMDIPDPKNKIKVKKIVKFKNVKSIEYLKVIKLVLINCVQCAKLEYIHLPVSGEKEFYSKIVDIEIVSELKSLIRYHKNVIIIPHSILKIETIASEEHKINNIVGFKDPDKNLYQGKIVWTGNVNEVSVAVIILRDDHPNEDIGQYLINGNFMGQNIFSGNGLGIVVGQFALVHCPVNYITCKTTGLEVVDHKFYHPFQKVKFEDKLITFEFDGGKYAGELKYKALIHNELCIGCQLNIKSDQGSKGKYGKDRVFECRDRSGVIITADKINSTSIKGLCEFGYHKEIRYKSETCNCKIYDQNSICCIQHLTKLEDNMANLKIGSKILKNDEFIGVCKFIGKVNDHPTVGIEEEELRCFDCSVSWRDYMDDYIFKNKKFHLINTKDITIGSYYRTNTQGKIYDAWSNNIGDDVHYYLNNDREESPLRGKLIWLGIHDNGSYVFGLDLEAECSYLKQNYLLEDNLFEYTKNGIIDDISKLEPIDSCCEHESLSKKESFYEELVKRLLTTNSSNETFLLVQDTLCCFPEESIKYLNNNKDKIPSSYLPTLLDHLYTANQFDKINDYLSDHEIMKQIWPNLYSFLSRCMDDNKFDLIRNALNSIKPINTSNDIPVCLQLAIKCLENFSKINRSEYENLYKLLIDKCSNEDGVVKHSNLENDTFLGKIISNKLISEETVIYVLQSKKFDTQARNSEDKLPVEISVQCLKFEITRFLILLGCDKSTKQRLTSILFDLKGKYPNSKEIDLMFPIITES